MLRLYVVVTRLDAWLTPELAIDEDISWRQLSSVHRTAPLNLLWML